MDLQLGLFFNPYSVNPSIYELYVFTISIKTEFLGIFLKHSLHPLSIGDSL